MPFRTRANLRLALLTVGTIALTACPQRVRLEVIASSRSDSLVFAVRGPREGRPVAVKFVLVRSCDASFGGPADVYWELDASDSPSAILSLTYGVTPSGYTETASARQLERGGCYAVAYGAASFTYVAVDSTGGVSEVAREAARLHAAHPR